MGVKKKLDTIVYNLLIESFYNEEYSAGQVLNPAEIAEKYDISKTPVLQALKRLENEKILDVSSGGKYTLIRPNAVNIREICSIRYMFEAYAAETVLERLTEQEYETLLAMAEKCRNTGAGCSSTEILNADYSFHKYLVSLIGNSVVDEFFETIINRYILLKYVSGCQNVLRGILEYSYVSHKKIAELLYCREKEELLEFLRQHIYFELS